MSKEYCEFTGEKSEPTTDEVMRKHCQRPGRKDKDGNTVYFTEQNHKKECDINLILKKYDKTGLIQHLQKFEGKFGDLTGMDFKTMQDTIADAKTNFNLLPAEVRSRFENNPAKLLEFMENPQNREEGIELGLIAKDTPEEIDGFGEHVQEKDAHKTEKDEDKKE